MNDLLTPDEVAAELRVGRGVVYRLIREHKLAASRVGRAYRVRRDDVGRYLDAWSTRERVRAALFAQVDQIRQRNATLHPGMTSDDLLEELEAEDEARKQARRAARV